MSLNFESLKQVDSNTKDLVNGYIKGLGNDESTIIPSLVVSICILFYNLQEFFAICGDVMTIDSTLTRLTTRKVEEKPFRRRCSCYGNVIITNKYECIYSWELKIVSSNDNDKRFGITSDTSILNQRFTDTEKYFYAIASLGYRKSHQQPYHNKCTSHGIWRTGDIIKININTKERSFKLMLNDCKEDTIFENMEFDEETKYRFAISNSSKKSKANCIELVSFNCVPLD